ncbi:hypothetical protein MLD38_020309 [Melastoma candidum]|uniref:Uncharacterized protein n=1 Tax=Melastoma candidum TaxID=119954 RepID=A0ACB9QED8_9MYRT|nr:hypothetical protein MLD38_020309 [Melastoma candidum]
MNHRNSITLYLGQSGLPFHGEFSNPLQIPSAIHSHSEIPFDPRVKGHASAKNPTAVDPAVGKLVLTMSRPWVLVILFLMIVFTSQFEWKQQFGNEPEPKPISSSKEDIGRREEVVKEKIILLQERNIQKLQELVRNLHQQLLICKRDNINVTSMPFDEMLTKLDRMPTWED